MTTVNLMENFSLQLLSCRDLEDILDQVHREIRSKKCPLEEDDQQGERGGRARRLRAREPEEQKYGRISPAVCQAWEELASLVKAVLLKARLYGPAPMVDDIERVHYLLSRQQNYLDNLRLFSTSLEVIDDLDAGPVPEEVIETFKRHRFPLAQTARIELQEEDRRWKIANRGHDYLIVREDQALHVYDRYQNLLVLYTDYLDMIYGAIVRHILRSLPTDLLVAYGHLSLHQAKVTREVMVRSTCDQNALEQLVDMLCTGEAFKVELEFRWRSLAGPG